MDDMTGVSPIEPPVVSPVIDLPMHEANSIARAKRIEHKIKQLKKGNTMSTTTTPDVNFLTSGLGGMTGTGAGAAGVAGFGGALLGSVLTGNGGLFGNRDGGVTAANINTDNAIAASERLTNARFDALGQRDIEAAVERTAAATQLAVAVGQAALGVEIAKGQGEINTQVALTTGNLGTQNALNAAALGVQVQKTSGDTQTQMATQTAALGVQAEKTAAANALAVAMGLQVAEQANAQHAFNASQQLAQTQYTLATAIKADGDLTRGLIIAQNDAELNRRLVIQANEITELRNEGRRNADSAETRIQISNVNMAVAAQAQSMQQQQQQAQFQINGQLLSAVQALVSQNQTIHQGIVNLGTMTGNSQTAANTRVN